MASRLLLVPLALLSAMDLPAASAAQAFSALPLRFEPNLGQADPAIQFVARSGASTVLLGAHQAVLRRRGTQPVRIDLDGSNPTAIAEPLDQLPARSHYFRGAEPARWRRDVPNFARVRYRGVWPGIDLVYYGNGDRLEYDFVVAPGADPRAIGLVVDGATPARVAANGDLLLGSGVRQHRPVVYQDTRSGRHRVGGSFVLAGRSRVRFRIGKYDSALPLVIDPVLSYSTLFGGTLTDGAIGIAVDSGGNAYITGVTDSPDLPATAEGIKYKGKAPPDVFVAKIKPDGSGVVYCSYIGGGGDDEPDGIAVDGAGNAYVTGYTLSGDFPTTTGAPQATYGGGKGDAFVFKLGPAGNALVYSTYLGGSSEDEGRAIAVDAAGNAYVAGITSSSAFPIIASAYQSKYRGGPYDGFVAKLNPAGTALVYSTLLGSSGDDEPLGLAIDSTGNAYVTGSTDASDFPTTKTAFLQIAPNPNMSGFVTKLNPAGSALVYSTYLGGNIVDAAAAIAVDSAGNAYVVGSTASNYFPKTNGALQTTFGGGLLDAFVCKLKADASGLIYSTFLGGSDIEGATAVAIDAAGNAYVAGNTASTDFPVSGNPFQPAIGGSLDGFVVKLNANGSALGYGSYLGGSLDEHANGIAIDAAGAAYVAGNTASANFRTTSAALRKSVSVIDGFVVKVQDVALPSLAVDNASPTFHYNLGAAAPGPQTVQVTSTGSALAFTATTSGANWLAVGPGSGTTPAGISVFVNPAGLNAGSYNGNVVLASTGAANSPLNVLVKLNVMQGQPAPVLAAILPSSIPAGSADTTITATGANFVGGSVIDVNGAAIATTFVNSTTLTAVAPAADFTQPGVLAITVANPGQSGVLTTPLNLTVTAPLPAAAADGVMNAASLLGGPVAPGEVLAIGGSNLGPATAVQGDAGSGAYPTTLSGARVWFDNTAAPLLAASATRITAVVPFGIDGQQTTQLQLEYNGQKSAAVTLGVAPAAPALYTFDGSGQGEAQASNADSTPNGKDNPAAAGTVVTLFATGGGQTTPASVDGAVVSDTSPQLNQALGVQIGGLDCDGVSASPAPGLVSGIIQVTAQVPAGLTGTVPVVLTIGGIASQPGVTLEVTAPPQ